MPATETDEDARIRAKFMSLGNAAAAPSEPTSMRKFIYSPNRATPIRELVPGWIEAGQTIMVSARGGSHKSRLILQLCLSLLYDRDLFEQRGASSSGMYRLGNGARRGGVNVGHVEFLSYEDDEAKIHRRVEQMKAGFKIAAEPGEDDPSDRMALWPLTSSRPPLLEVVENGEVTLTAFGYRMLRRWEKLAEDGRHMVLWFDSFFNAVQFLGNSKNIDICAQRVIGILNHWCEVLNCTILGPYHPSRAGDDRGDTGYSPAFQDTLRQVLSISEKTRNVPKGRHNEKEGTGNYVLRIMKWNEGPQGKKITFTYADGQLVTHDDIAECDAMASVQAAVAVVERFTYQDDKVALARLRAPGLTDGERSEIEKRFAERIRSKGIIWNAGAFRLGRDHQTVLRFREITGNERATEKDLLAALEAARRAGLLDYAESDQSVKGTRRRPAGYCIAASPVDDDPYSLQ